MDAIQFGKWISERRRKYGWSSQRALVESIRQDPALREWHVSEDFLARLEAGRLAHPFRGYVRLQILTLAWVLCKSVRELQTYVQAASLKDLSSDETELLQCLEDHLSIRHSVSMKLLPARPDRLIGRDDLLDEVVQHLCTLDRGLYAITGMPGVGKSVVAYEVLHRMAALEQKRFFHDGVIALSCKGRHGPDGLLALLYEVARMFASAPQQISQNRAIIKNENVVARDHKGASTEHTKDVRGLPAPLTDLAGMIDHVRMVLAGKSVLFLLDDIEPQFLLREALGALLGHAQKGTQGTTSSAARCVVLTTSRHIPARALVSQYCPVEPLQQEDGVALFHLLVKGTRGAAIEMSAQERAYVEQICSALGNLPLAIERAVDVVAIEGIPLALLATNIVEDPLSSLLDSDEELFQTFEQAFRMVGYDLQTFFALLALPRRGVITLEEVAALYTHSDTEQGDIEKVASRVYALPERMATATGTRLALVSSSSKNIERIHATASRAPTTLTHPSMTSSALTTAAVMVGRFVSHSLLERVDGEEHIDPNNPRYRLHPLLYAYARKLLNNLPARDVRQARSSLLRYVDAYLERYQGDVKMIERAQVVMLDALEMAWHQEDYAFVKRLVVRMAIIVGRMPDVIKGEYILRRGIQASQHINDTYSQSYLLTHLGLLYCYDGKLEAARQHWQRSLEIAEDAASSSYLWRPYLYLAHLEYLQGNTKTAYDLATEFLQRVQQTGDLRSLAAGHLARGFYYRLLGDIEHAHDDICSTLSLLFMLGSDVSSSEQLLELNARSELAYIIGDYAGAEKYIKDALLMVQRIETPYTHALLLLQQARIARQRGLPEEVHRIVAQMLKVAPHASQLREPGVQLFVS